jgi:hypothetical protein
VTDWAAAWFCTSSALAPVAWLTVAATPSLPSHKSVATGPGLTVFDPERAAGSQFADDREPDAFAAPGDDRCPPRQADIHTDPPVRTAPLHHDVKTKRSGDFRQVTQPDADR